MERETVSVNTLSEMLDVKPRTIRDWVFKRRIPFYKMNGLVRFDIKKVRAWRDGTEVRAIN